MVAKDVYPFGYNGVHDKEPDPGCDTENLHNTLKKQHHTLKIAYSINTL